MKKFKFFFLLIVMTVLTACGQQKKYVSYTVKEGETIRSIAKDNGIKTRDLLRLNPDVSRKPSPDTVIIIPNNTTTSSTDSKGLTHKVKRKENLFSISQKYGVTVEALRKENNIAGNRITRGDILRIPSKVVIVEEVKEVVLSETEVVLANGNFETHLVVKDDTIYNLTKRFNISEEELMAMNPTLKEGLNLGMVLNVGEKSIEVSEELTPVFRDVVTSKPLNIVLMLPYKLNSTSDYNSQFKKRNSLLNIVTDFHSGVLIAIDSLKSQGMHVNLKVIDTENSTSKINAIINETDFSNVDAIIGPLFLKNAKYVADKVGVPVIAPMYSKNQTSISDGNLVKVAPNKDLIEEKLVDYMLANYSGESIIIIGDASTATSNKITQLVAKLKSHESINNITILKPEKGYIKKSRFTAAIGGFEENNWVVLIGEDNIVTADVVNNLGVLSAGKHAIQLFSFAKGKNFDYVSNNHLARLKFTYPKENFTDVTKNSVKVFKRKYKAVNKINPSGYAIKGFDVAYDALLRLSSSDSFDDGVELGVSQRVATKFEYHKKFFGSTENRGVFLIQYQEDLKLKSLD